MTEKQITERIATIRASLRELAILRADGALTEDHKAQLDDLTMFEAPRWRALAIEARVAIAQRRDTGA